MTALTDAPDWPLASEDLDWFAFPRTWTRREVVSELAHNLIDWWLDEYCWYDDDDRPHGWFAAYRSLFAAIRPAHVVAAYDDEFGERIPGWWEEGHSRTPGAVAAWVVAL